MRVAVAQHAKDLRPVPPGCEPSRVRGTAGHGPLGAALRKARKRAGLSLRDAAGGTGISYSTLSRVENGLVPMPSLEAAAAVARNVGLDEGEALRLAGRLAPPRCSPPPARCTLQTTTDIAWLHRPGSATRQQETPDQIGGVLPRACAAGAGAPPSADSAGARAAAAPLGAEDALRAALEPVPQTSGVFPTAASSWPRPAPHSRRNRAAAQIIHATYTQSTPVPQL
ncbi:helix-turn-helix domain-containing protein [Streptomyces sp. NPDC002758]